MPQVVLPPTTRFLSRVAQFVGQHAFQFLVAQQFKDADGKPGDIEKVK